MRPLDALLISDGRPGHYHLSEGILAAVGRSRPLTITRLQIERKRLASGRLLALLVRAGASPARLLSVAYDLSPADIPPADLVVSAGGDTLAANVAAARLTGAANVFYGSLRAYRPDWFSLVLTSYRAQAAEPFPLVTLKPSPLDPNTLPEAASAGERLPATLGVLIGGDGSGVAFDDADWDDLSAAIATLARSGVRLIVSNSRRTPGAVSDRLAAIAASGDNVALIDVRSAGAGTLGEIFRQADAILCTTDSSSMLSEAIWARRRVLALAPRIAKLPPMERDYRGLLAATGSCGTAALAGLSVEAIAAELSKLRPLATNPLDDLAGMLATRLPVLGIAAPGERG